MPRFTDTPPEALNDFNFIYEREIVWGDMDAMNHVNNTRYLHFCESARIDFLRSQPIFAGTESPSQRISEGIALAAVDCRFKAPVVYPDTLLIGVGIQNIKETSFTILHHLYSTKLERVAAISHAELVSYDFAKLKRVPINDSQKAFLDEFAYTD